MAAKQRKTEKIEIRMTPRQKNYLKGLMKNYGYKSISGWVMEALLGWRPKMKEGK